MELNPYASPMTETPRRGGRWRRLIGIGFYCFAALLLLSALALVALMAPLTKRYHVPIRWMLLEAAIKLVLGFAFWWFGWRLRRVRVKDAQAGEARSTGPLPPDAAGGL